MRRSYALKLLLLVVGMVVLIQISTYLAARASIRDTGMDNGHRELTVAADIFTELLANRATQLQQSASVLVDDSRFQQALTRADSDAVQSILRAHASRSHASYATVIADNGIRVSLDGNTDQVDPVLEQPAADNAVTVRLLDGRPYETVVVPLSGTAVAGSAGLGLALDASLATAMKKLTGLDVSFIAPDVDPQRPAFIASTLPADAARMLPAKVGGGHDRNDARLLSLADSDMLTLDWRLNQSGRPVYVALQLPMSRVLGPYQLLSNNLLWLNLAGILVAIIVGALLARDVTRPVRALARAARRITGGDYANDVNVRSNDEFGELAQAFSTMQSAIADREQRILQQSRLDPLTGLGNRSTSRSAVAHAIRHADAGDGKCAALTIDLRRFKDVNDVFGHQAGDSLLQVIALRLLGSVKEKDSVIRLGADVFMIVLEDADTQVAMNVAERIGNALAQSVELQDLNISINAHIGVAVFPDHGRESEELMRRSDVAMHVAKESGAPISLYQPGTDEQYLRRLGLLRDLKDALAQSTLYVAYQPKAALVDHDYIGAEALIRWKHPSLGQLSPEEFVSIAESAGYINQLTRWMLNSTLEQLGKWHAAGIPVHLSVNISAHDLVDDDLPGYLSDLLTRHEISPGYLCLEMTESSIMLDEQKGLIMLDRLKSMGLRLSIDDFGTGFSSLSQLKRMPVDELKIDKSFILKLDENEDDIVIVRSTIELGHNMGLSVVAEGVENDASLGILGQYGCDMIQGYFLGKPMPATDLLDWAKHWRKVAAAQHA